MQLKDLKPRWNELTRTQKLEIIESSNERRLLTLEKRRSKKTKSTSTKKKSKSKKSVPKSADGLARLVKDMSPEDLANFKLMIQLEKDKK